MKTLQTLLLSAFMTLPVSVAWSQSPAVAPSANPPAAAAPAPAVAPVATPQAPTKAVKSTIKTIKTAEGSFAAMRGAKGIYWNYTVADSSNGVLLKETENTEKSIVLEGYGLKFTIDPVALRLIYTEGATKKAININEASVGVSTDNLIEVTYSAGKFSFIEDVDGHQDVWEQTLKDGKKHQLMDQGGIILYDPIRKILIALDVEKKLITFDFESKKPSTQKMLELRGAQ